ncbi:MAG: N-acetyltransferase [Bacteroidetes bacterium]|nr:MAG: N-acetyltransferase [Bacteroidota bacterium]
MEIRPAKPADAETLTVITRRSKAHWGYSPEQLEDWADELTISPAYIRQHTVFCGLLDENVVAYYSLHGPEGERCKLENLFVLPEYIGRGLGARLLEHATAQAATLQASILWLESDPHATGFYQKNGFVPVGQKPSSIPGRFLPVMERKVKANWKRKI